MSSISKIINECKEHDTAEKCDKALSVISTGIESGVVNLDDPITTTLIDMILDMRTKLSNKNIQ